MQILERMHWSVIPKPHTAFAGKNNRETVKSETSNKKTQSPNLHEAIKMSCQIFKAGFLYVIVYASTGHFICISRFYMNLDPVIGLQGQAVGIDLHFKIILAHAL